MIIFSYACRAGLLTNHICRYLETYVHIAFVACVAGCPDASQTTVNDLSCQSIIMLEQGI